MPAAFTKKGSSTTKSITSNDHFMRFLKLINISFHHVENLNTSETTILQMLSNTLGFSDGLTKLPAQHVLDLIKQSFSITFIDIRCLRVFRFSKAAKFYPIHGWRSDIVKRCRLKLEIVAFFYFLHVHFILLSKTLLHCRDLSSFLISSIAFLSFDLLFLSGDVRYLLDILSQR